MKMTYYNICNVLVLLFRRMAESGGSPYRTVRGRRRRHRAQLVDRSSHKGN